MWLQKELGKEKHGVGKDDKYIFLALQLRNSKEQLRALQNQLKWDVMIQCYDASTI